jgi:beta-lactamase regulating signal transducer with metallopeptidase domain
MFFATNSLLLKALGWGLVHSFWQFALLMLLYTALTTIFPRLKAAAKHTLSLYLLVAGSVFFIGTFCYQYFYFTGTTIGLALSSTELSENTTGYNWFTAREWIDRLSPYFSLAYLAIITIFICRLASWFITMRGWRDGSLQKPPVEWRLFVQQRAAQMGISKKISLHLSSLTDTPQVIGYIKPIILLPVSCITHLTPLQIETVLLHELAHIKRNDFFINALTAFASVIFFFNPFTRRLIIHLRDERENACDDWVLQFCYPAQEYATTLLLLEKNRRAYTTLQIAAGGNKKDQLLHRVQRILQVPQHRRPSLFIWLNLLVIMAFLFTLVLPSVPATNTKEEFAVTLPSFLTANFIDMEPAVTEGQKTIYTTVDSNPLSTAASLQPTTLYARKTPKQPAITKIDPIRAGEPAPEDEDNMFVLATGNNDLTLQLISTEAVTQEPEPIYTLPEYVYPPSPFNTIDHQANEPFLPSKSFEYYAITDSAFDAAGVKNYTEAIVKAELAVKAPALEKLNKNLAKKIITRELETIRQNYIEKKQLLEGRQLQGQVILKLLQDQQKKLQQKSGKNRIIHI